MPELPEITLYKNYLDETCLQKKIVEIDFLHTGALQAPEEDFRQLRGKRFESSQRLGKYLLVKTDNGPWLVLHFGMTGKLEYFKNQELPKYTRICFKFEDGYQLAYVCRRKLGKLFLTENARVFQEGHDLGDDALELSEEEFLGLLEGKTGSIKGVLTDQHVIAGIGNVYSDEMLYQCEIHPKTTADNLSKKEKRELFSKMKEILKVAIKVGGKRSEFPKGYLLPHRKEGKDCPRCEGEIKKISVSGRSTYFCPACQIKKD